MAIHKTATSAQKCDITKKLQQKRVTFHQKAPPKTRKDSTTIPQKNHLPATLFRPQPGEYPQKEPHIRVTKTESAVQRSAANRRA